MAPFETLGERARWEFLYELFVAAEDEQLVTYEQLAKAIDVDHADPKGKQIVQMAVRRAAKQLEDVNKRAIKNVPRQGYQVVKPEGQLDLAELHHKKAGRSLKRGHSKVVNVDLNRVEDPEVRKAFGAVAHVIGQQMEVNRRVASKIKKHDWAIEQLRNETAHTAAVVDAEVEDLRHRQASMEERLVQIAGKLGLATIEEEPTE